MTPYAEEKLNVIMKLVAERSEIEKKIAILIGEGGVDEIPTPPPVPRKHLGRPKKAISNGSEIVAKLKVCGKCKQPGHSGWHCPQKNKEPMNSHKNPNFASGVGTVEEKRSWEETRDLVQEMQRDGKNSLQIASKLKINLKEVNKYWDKPDAPAPESDEDEETDLDEDDVDDGEDDDEEE